MVSVGYGCHLVCTVEKCAQFQRSANTKPSTLSGEDGESSRLPGQFNNTLQKHQQYIPLDIKMLHCCGVSPEQALYTASLVLLLKIRVLFRTAQSSRRHYYQTSYWGTQQRNVRVDYTWERRIETLHEELTSQRERNIWQQESRSACSIELLQPS